MKTGIYARVSTDRQTTDNQTFKLKEYVKIREFKIVKTYIDEDISGKIRSRPGLNELMDDVKSGLINCVLVWKIDRLGRSTRDLLEIIDFFRIHNCNFISFTDNIDVTTPAGRMLYTFLAALAELESAQISERTRAAYDRKKAHAEALGNKVRWGRKPNNLTGPELDLIFKLRSKKLSWREIAEYVNKDREKKISYSTIRRLFQNRGG